MPTVLVVDDESATRELVSDYLEGKGWQVATAETGASALEQLAQFPHAVVLLGLHLPDMDGMEILKRLRESGQKVPVVLVSGFIDGRVWQEALKLEALVLPKPFRLHELAKTIESAMK